jgi:Skp family chaperone for outer membrane proteins
MKILPIVILLISAFSCKSYISNKNAISYVNPTKLLQGYHSAQAQHELFQAKARDWQLRIDSLGAELQALRSAPAATRAAKEQQLGQYREAIQQRAQQSTQRLTQAVRYA